MLIIKLLKSVGVDCAVGYTVLGRIWNALAGMISLTVVAAFLSPEGQGYYYTFGNVIAMQVFFELGLTNVILQFSSHEKAKLFWTKEGILDGDDCAKARLSSLLRITLKWYSIIAILVVLSIIPAGLIFFTKYQSVSGNVVWRLPWILVIVVTSLVLLISPVFSILEGCGLVGEVAKIRTYQAIATYGIFWLALSQHWGLFAVPVFYGVGFLMMASWLIITKKRLLTDLLAFSSNGIAISWRHEVWPLQWKIALSWLSGYFIFQLFNPVLFAYYGPVEAGKMGMSLSVVSGISALALAWVGTKSAPFGHLIANKEYAELDKLFFRSLKQSIVVIGTSGILFFLLTLYLYNTKHSFSHRLLEPLPLSFLIAATFVNHFVVSQAIYLRAHKREPFLWISITNGTLVGLSTFFLGRCYGTIGMMMGYFIINLVIGLGVGSWIFFKCRRTWHAETIECI